jgi:hypothetical protein
VCVCVVVYISRCVLCVKIILKKKIKVDHTTTTELS